MTKTRPISILIPHYEKTDALTKTHQELILQIQPEDEIIVIDDHSPNGVPEFDCSCTTIIKPPKHIPHIYRLNTLRNYGVEHAKHDACLILDPDCVPHKNFLNHARKIYDPSVLFTGWIWYMNEDGSVLRKEGRQRGDGEIGISRWIDKNNRDCNKVLGGCMYFSKRRAKLVGLFDTSFDGTWGWEEHAFASTCRNSGMRLRFEIGLTVYHQWHKIQHYGHPEDNKRTHFLKIGDHRKYLNAITPYHPAVAVLVVSKERPRRVDQVMRSIFRHAVPLKVRLVNNGDQSKQQLDAMSWWSDRWAVDYINYTSPKPTSTIWSDAMRYYSQKRYKYLIVLGEDVTPIYGSITRLILEMEKNPQYHAISGYIVNGDGKKKADNGNHLIQIIRLNKVVPYPEEGNWSDEVKKQGLQVGFTEKAGAYHHPLATVDGTNSSRSKKEGCLVTIILSAVARVDVTKATIEGIVKYANFPHVFKAIIHPERIELIKWAKNIGIEVIPKFYSPIVRAKATMVQLCKTKYLLMFDNDMVPLNPMKPLLDFMEAHPKVGVCAMAIEGGGHSLLQYGAMVRVTKNRVFTEEKLKKKLPFRYCNYVHHGATMFRMAIFKKVAYDVNYPGQGHEHEDIFLQLSNTPWKIVNYNAVGVKHQLGQTLAWYSRLRGSKTKDSFDYFKNKWNIKEKRRVK